MEIKIHSLANGATVLVTSPGHGFKFNDGTFAEPQHKAVCDALSVKREFVAKGEIAGMKVTECRQSLTDEGIALLRELCSKADVVLVPFMVISALREQGKRDEFPNALAFNSTPETARSAPADKVIDVNNWSY